MTTVLGLFALSFVPSLEAKGPNPVFLFSDDHATQAIGAYGHEIANLAPTPISAGKYSHQSGFFFNDDTEFDGSQVTFPQLIRGAGDQTAIIGKRHLGSVPHEITNHYHNGEYKDVVERMHAALSKMRKRYKVPKGIPTPRAIDNPQYHLSTERLERLSTQQQ